MTDETTNVMIIIIQTEEETAGYLRKYIDKVNNKEAKETLKEFLSNKESHIKACLNIFEEREDEKTYEEDLETETYFEADPSDPEFIKNFVMFLYEKEKNSVKQFEKLVPETNDEQIRLKIRKFISDNNQNVKKLMRLRDEL
ncbi:hypothetical protein D6745_04780 [Candidatus Woesearchaeota archaeon]|nr:MAG: hypothetical protein D6745_04780 [Candidatus Woesearchaeota archaeon]